ncbi:MAG: pilus assembly protein PilW [Moraxellaceae bacterium]|jgi:type IV pilus assembly protein PilW|nr:pilus assembly protein PilW [Moraxellaceae bacterium]
MKRMQGFSMVELMVSTVLGLLISAAAIQLFLANQVSLNFQRGMNDVQANGRFAIDAMTREIIIAGLGPSVSSSSSGSDDFNGVVLPSTPAGGGIPGYSPGTMGLSYNNLQTTTTVPGLLSNSDQLVIQYFANNSVVDCEGNTVAAGRYVVSRYFVAADTANANIPSLKCDAGSHNGTALATGGGGVAFGGTEAGAVLLPGVESFQILYGVDDRVISGTQNNRALPAQYITADAYNALAVKPEIVAVRLGLYLRSQESSSNDVPASADVMVLDQPILAANIPTDGLIRRLFVTTIILRNLDLRKV